MLERSPKLHLEIVSDTICPWCYVGKRRIEKALAAIGDDLEFSVHWRPYELNPDMPREGMDRREYRSKKFGSWAHSQELDAGVVEAGKIDGLKFRHDLMQRTPNTAASHMLIRLAAEETCQDKVVENLFSAYFCEGRDVGDLDVLTEIGVTAGMKADGLKAALGDDVLRAEVRSEALGFAQAGLNGVPSFLLNRFTLFSGAQSPDLIENVLRRAAAHEDVIAAGAEAVNG